MNNLSITQNNLSLSTSNVNGILNYNRNYMKTNEPTEQDIDIGFNNKTTYQFKVVFLGDCSVGKTSLINRFLDNAFYQTESTISCEFKVKKLGINSDIDVELTLWDTAGSERYRATTRQYYRDAHGIMLMFAVNDRKSFENLDSWVEGIENCAPENCVVILIGNKTDLEREVTTEEANEFAEKNKFKYFEVSCKEGVNIIIPFNSLAKDIVDKLKDTKDKNNNNCKSLLEKTLKDNKEIIDAKLREKKREKETACC